MPHPSANKEFRPKVMKQNLVIVESPAKAKTLQKYLGDEFKILASYGHVRELVPKTGSVDPDHNFAMKYQIIEKNKKYLQEIIKSAQKSEDIYLATDPDREGEAISWHLTELMKENSKLKSATFKRVEFHEITKTAIVNAIANPRILSMDLVEAQQARRALDYLVGFNLSPLLWKKIKPGLSAGRVQSPALRMICEREKEIRNFKEQEYWTIHLETKKDRVNFEAKLREYEGKVVDQFDVNSEEIAKKYIENMQGEAVVKKVEQKPSKRRPAAPFTTSTLQQEAVRKLGFTTDRTMRIAQQLYEGIDLGARGTTGLITYMRTDSVTLAKEAVASIRDYILKNKGKEYLPASAPMYKTKSKNAQEAHEAIRPTDINLEPDSLRGMLSADQFKLYSLIWKRAIASQMSNAEYLQTYADIDLGKGVFRATGRVIKFDGFLSVYIEDTDEGDKKSDDGDDSGDNKRLPPLEAGDKLPVLNVRPDQHFTIPPARFTEASLVKSLEEYGIGRPSTYATIISVLKNREYVVLDKKSFSPTEVGEVVNDFLTEHFFRYVDYNFTAGLENDLDEIANGQEDWLKVMDNFWKEFKAQIEAKSSLTRQEAVGGKLDEVCPLCGKHNLEIKFGRRGRFIACSGYPECTYTRNLNESVEESLQNQGPQFLEDGRTCPDCGSPLVYKKGRYGKFIGCSNYPNCKHIESINKPAETGFDCPACGKGHIVQKRSRYGKIFYSCDQYPKCNYALWDHPVKMKCPNCGAPYMTLKAGKRKGVHIACPNKECKTTFDYLGNWEELGLEKTFVDELLAEFPTPNKK